MSIIFTLNPIKINIININNSINKTIIFIGTVPKEVKSELLKIEASGKYDFKNKTLIKFYGKNWFIKLGIKKHLKSGGSNHSTKLNNNDEFLFEDSEVSVNLNSTQPDMPDEEISEIVTEISEDNTVFPNEKPEEKQHELESELSEIKNNNQFDNETNKTDQANETNNIISMEDLDDNDETQLENRIPNSVEEDSLENVIHQITKSKGIIKFIFDDPYISLYPEDNMLEFKTKLYAILKIPIFRQHIWYVFQGRSYPVNYSIFDNDILKYINIQNMLNNLNDDTIQQQLIEGIPINTIYHQRKLNLKITTDDTFSILSEFYHKYGITEYNLLDLNDFIAPARTELNNIISDKYQIDLLYYGFIILYWPMLSLEAFSDYIKSETNIPNFYPELQLPINETIQKYKLEKKIIDEKNDLITNHMKKDDLQKINKTLSNSITDSIISLLTYENSLTTIILIRNLFDEFPLNKMVISCKCNFIHNNRKIILNKKFKDNDFINQPIELNSIMFKIKIDNESNRNIKLIIYKNGNYIIKSSWREEEQYNFDSIVQKCYDLTKPVIEQINTFGSNVLLLKKKLPFISKHNIKFTEIGMSIFYKKIFSVDEFNILKDILKDFKLAGIIIDKSFDLGILEYYFSKGMFQYNKNRIERNININNYYEFLTEGVVKQKWNTTFEKSRITKIQHRISDIKIEIIGIKEKEFYIFYNFIITLFYLFKKNKKLKQPSSSQNEQNNNQDLQKRILKKSLKNLKEQDPVLYNFKNKYKSKNVYSKICQKPYQPLLLNKQAYDILPKDIKEKAIKYWNFTSNKDVYYSCPNSKYSYIKFIVNKHPKDYCIPCCKKTQISQNNKDAKKIIHDICIKTHKYEKLDKTITLGSRYIMSYGKDIESGRLSRLPDESLEPLFYETYSVNTIGVDPECIKENGYYLYGVEQNIKHIQNIGIIIILINATETNIYDFIKNCIKLLKISPNKFRIILDGKITKYFNKLDDFILQLSNVFINQPVISQTINKNIIPWNEIFISFSHLFLNINIIYFNTNKNETISLILPSYITNKEQFVSTEFTNLFILKKKEKYFPIYLLNTDVFFKVKMITQKIFNYNDPIMIIIGKLVSNYFNELLKINIFSGITLDIINKFLSNKDASNSNSSYKIKKLFINNSNLCYYAHITNNSNNNIFIPIELSSYLTNDNIIITYEVFLRNKNAIDINLLLKFSKDFNFWVAKQSEKNGLMFNTDKNIPLEERVQPLYSYIKIKSWLVLCDITKEINNNSTVIGFTSNNLNYYIKNILLSQALKINNTSVLQVLYDPDIVNKSIYSKQLIITDNRSKNLGKSLYNNYLYKIILLEFIHIFNNQKNLTLRKKIKQLLLKNLNNEYDIIIKDISKCITNCDDCNKIKTQIYSFINTHHSKNLLFKSIDESIYFFDREIFECLKKLQKKEIYKELEKISKKFIIIGNINTIKDFEFPNMFLSCKNDKNNYQKYCKNNKIIISIDKLNPILELISSDILNPFKEKWLFSPVLTDNIINIFKFIKRPDELITIEILD
jgi:hypothetical protein